MDRPFPTPAQRSRRIYRCNLEEGDRDFKSGTGGAETISPKGSLFPAVAATTEGSSTAGRAANDRSGDSWDAAGRIIFFARALNPGVASGSSTG
jgi:hypothetical protein